MEEPKIPGGYILISRKIVESEIWDKPPLYIKVWLYLLTRAQHKLYRGLKRGQLYTSIPEIIESCSWKVGYRTVKPTKDQVYQVIDWLRKSYEAVHEAETKATMITTTKATQGLLVNIDNYSFYQDPKNYESNNESNNEKEARATRKQQQSNNTNKNDKNVKNEINKNKYLDNVFLKNCEYEKLVNEYSKPIVDSKIEDLDNYIGSTGKKYKDHNKTLRAWLKRDEKQAKQQNKPDSRNKEIAFQKWLNENPEADPNEFNWND